MIFRFSNIILNPKFVFTKNKIFQKTRLYIYIYNIYTHYLVYPFVVTSINSAMPRHATSHASCVQPPPRPRCVAHRNLASPVPMHCRAQPRPCTNSLRRACRFDVAHVELATSPKNCRSSLCARIHICSKEPPTQALSQGRESNACLVLPVALCVLRR